MTATATRAVPPPPPPKNGHRPAGQPLGLGSQRRLSWIMLGLLLTAGAALAFLAVLSASGSRTAVLVAAKDLQPGKPVEIGDLRTVSLTADDAVNMIPADQAPRIVGHVPVAPIRSGAVLSADLFGNGPSIDAGQTIVGTAFKAGELPSAALRTGDHVALVEVASTNPTDSGSAKTLAVGDVFAVDQVKDTGETSVSIRVPISQGAAVANASAQKRLRLLLVAGDTTSEQLQSSVQGTANGAPPPAPQPERARPGSTAGASTGNGS